MICKNGFLNIVLTGLMGCLAVACPATTAVAAETKVVVTVKPIHALVSGIMAGVGTPRLLVEGSASPHTFTLKPSGAQAVQQADVFVRVSEGLEPFTQKVAAALPASVKLISLVDVPGLKVLDQRHGDTFEAHENHGEGHNDHDKHDDHAKHDDHDHDHDKEKDSAAKDGHIWLDPTNAKAIAAEITKVLSTTYPEHATAFAANAGTLTGKLDALAADIESDLAPVKGKPFIVFHDATQYFEARFGLAAAGSVTVSPDVQPSAKRLTAVRKKIAALGAVCVFAEPGFQPKLIAAVTDNTSARSGTLDPEGTALTAGPELYFDLMRSLARNMKTCLAPSS